MRSSGSRRTVSWKARGLLALAVAGLWVWAPWSSGLEAQTIGPPVTAAPFPACVNLQITNRLANSPAPGDENFFEDPDTLLGAVWLCAGNYAVSSILPIGRALLGGLVIIMFVWTGVGFMFSGQLDFGSLLGTLFLAGFGFILLDNYFFASEVSWLPGAQPGRGIVGLFAEEAVELSSIIIGDADTNVARAFVAARNSAAETEEVTNIRIAGDPDRNYAEEIDNPWPDESSGAWLRRFRLQLRMIPIVLIKWLTTIVLALVGWMIYAQYVWGFFCLAVLTMLGPILIPWMMIPQLDFLFWGWVKAMINGVIYMLTASALYAATAMLLVAPLERIADAPLPGDPGSMAGVAEISYNLGVEYLPMVIMALFAALKVGAISGMIVSGGTPPGSGLGSALTKAESGTRSLAGWKAGRAGARDGGQVLSTDKGRQRAAEALREANRRAGGGRMPGGGGGSKGGGPKGTGGGKGKNV